MSRLFGPLLYSTALLIGLSVFSSCSVDNSDISNDNSGTGVPANVTEKTLYEFVFSVFEDDDQDVTAHKQYHLAGQSLVSDCMAEEGFEYIPFVRSVRTNRDSLSDEERTELYGFGYSTEIILPDQSFEQSEPAGLREPAEPEDPNLAIIASLSATEQIVYRETLYGDVSDDEAGGCQTAKFDAPVPPRLAVFDEFNAGFADANKRAQADPRMHQLLREWSECMERAGFPFSSRNDMFDDLSNRVDPFEKMIQSQWDERIRLFESAPGGEISDLPADVQRVLESDPTIPPEHRGAFDSLVDYEISLAKGDLVCSYFEAAGEIYDEYNKKYVDDNALAILEFFNG